MTLFGLSISEISFLSNRGLHLLIELSLTLKDIVSRLSDLDQVLLAEVWADTERLWVLVLDSDGQSILLLYRLLGVQLDIDDVAVVVLVVLVQSVAVETLAHHVAHHQVLRIAHTLQEWCEVQLAVHLVLGFD
jgi:hypothetical protein